MGRENGIVSIDDLLEYAQEHIDRKEPMPQEELDAMKRIWEYEQEQPDA